MFSRRSSMILAASPADKDKRRRFSFFRSKSPEPIVTALEIEPRVVPPPSPTFSSNTSNTSEVSGSNSQRRRDSVQSVASSEYDTLSRNRTPSSLGQVLEAATEILEVAPDGLPTYASATHPSAPVTYAFARSSPFAMVLAPDATAGMSGHALYHVSVGVNVWMPSSTVTTIRRGGSETGPVVAILELGISSVPATITMGDVCKNLNQVYFRKSTSSSSRMYFTSQGTIKWKLGASSWQAHLQNTFLATFTPTAPYKLTLQPAGHRLSDHLMVSLVILMREHLTPPAGMKGDSAPLFNYSPHHNYQEE